MLDGSTDDKRALGRWAQDTAASVYDSALPQHAMRLAAGFSTKGTYYLARQEIQPNDSLQRSIFPGLESLESQYKALPIAEQHISGKGFIELLKYLRVVLLQDVAILATKYECSFFHTALFATDTFKVCFGCTCC